MASTSIVRFRPVGPWRFGPDSGARDRVDSICHSDALFSAVTHAMARLGSLEDWLAATTNESNTPAVRFSSLFPFQRETLFVPPPRSVWPPPASARIRYKAAKLVPVEVIQSLLSDQPIDEDRWILDGESECLVPSDRNRTGGPFRTAVRSNIAVDRLSQGVLEPHSTACLEFSPEAGVWMLVVFADDEARNRWSGPVRGALKLLSDTGLGGERSRGWGRSADPEWADGDSIFLQPSEEQPTAHWLLSVYDPASDDEVDWATGSYSTLTRSGRIESSNRWGDLKQTTRMIAEGSVLVSAQQPRGSVRNVAPEGFPHAVYRAGYAVSVPIPWRPSGTSIRPAEGTS
jgi:CRISPR type III-A-associated RAMP protein Csm4